ncbi:MAG: efflux RND transporter permease subunit, partial [Kiritimatiellae bacterium]|nr:efflux RND transporter permease subunit [Kiritimatiellia bacterium]
TMCVALVLSTTVALVLSPVLCAYMLKPPRERPSVVFAPFNWTLDVSRRGYLKFVGFFVRHGFLALLALAAAATLLWYASRRVPTTFLPKEDRGYISWYVRLAEGQSLERTIAIVDEFHDRVAKIPGVQSMSSRCGSNGLWGSGENLGGGLIRLEHWDDRKTPEKRIDHVLDEIRKVADDLHAGYFYFTQPPAIRGLGGSSGVGFNFCSIMGCEPPELLTAVDDFIATLKADPRVKSAMHGFTCSTPQIELKLDRRKAELLGLTPKLIFATLQNKLASYYVNDFNLKGGVYQVKLQNDPDYRGGVSDVLSIRIPTPKGAAVPISSLGSLEYVVGTRETMSYNKMLAAWCDVTPMPGVPSSEIMKLVETAQKPKGFDIEWGPVQLQEKENEGKLGWLMAAALIFAYLFLVAQYESWTIPLPVMLSVTFAVTGAFTGLWLTKTPLSVYAQLGCVMLIGLSAKNAILMVEFSRQRRAAGVPVDVAAQEGASLRFRAVQMTAWSFIIGVAPLIFANSAGAASMRAIGICTACGMLAATLVGIIFVPSLYAIFQKMRERFSGKRQK